ncbi:hypothetical protein DES52_11627 [Deinococcus yavapaiensis KR-236]|uniref:Uncharacterized protein n=1 Tax=Deinococcus yavapaiensis KR-236 TaxID=694435 RepID=A0A318S700_9DEIO|nr:hypothetical protein DES52_11627 [Deinococcus yavapaiensis KR-236]
MKFGAAWPPRKKGNITAVLEWVHEKLQPAVKRALGEDINVRVIPGRALDVRLDKSFTASPKDVRELVGDIMSEFDVEPFIRQASV